MMSWDIHNLCDGDLLVISILDLIQFFFFDSTVNSANLSDRPLKIIIFFFYKTNGQVSYGLPKKT